MDNTLPFDPESKTLNEPFRVAYRFLAEQSTSRSGALMRRYVTLLQRSGYKETPDSQVFLDQVLPQG